MSFVEIDQSTGDVKKQIAGSTLTAIYADAPLGAIAAFGGDTAPTGWLICDGSAISRTTYAALFAVIGTKYGSGDGSTTFNLPDGEAGAVLYPADNVDVGIAGSKYIIKAIATALPAEFQEEIDGCAKLAEANSFSAKQEIVAKDIDLKASNIELGVTPASDTWADSGMVFRDKNGNDIFGIRIKGESTGATNLEIITSGNNPNGRILINGVPTQPTELYTHTSNNETWGQLIQLAAAEIAKYPSYLGRLVINLGGGQYRWQSGPTWSILTESGYEISMFVLDLTNCTLHCYYSNNGTLGFTDYTSTTTSAGITIYLI